LETPTPELGGEETPENPNGEEIPETPAAEKPEEKSKELQSALAQKEHFRKKVGTLEKQLKSKGNEPEEWITTNDPLEVVRLGKALNNYSEEETEFIIRNASTKDIDGILKAEKDSMVQAAIQSTREKVARESKVPEPSSPFNTTSDVDVQKVIKEGRVEQQVAKQMEELLKKEGREGGI